MPSNPEHKYVSMAKAAAYADCNERTLRNMIAAGILTGYKLTRLRLGPPRSVVELVVLAVSGSGEVVLSGSRWRGVPL
jgi:hypothetical protein